MKHKIIFLSIFLLQLLLASCQSQPPLPTSENSKFFSENKNQIDPTLFVEQHDLLFYEDYCFNPTFYKKKKIARTNVLQISKSYFGNYDLEIFDTTKAVYLTKVSHKDNGFVLEDEKLLMKDEGNLETEKSSRRLYDQQDKVLVHTFIENESTEQYKYEYDEYDLMILKEFYTDGELYAYNQLRYDEEFKLSYYVKNLFQTAQVKLISEDDFPITEENRMGFLKKVLRWYQDASILPDNVRRVRDNVKINYYEKNTLVRKEVWSLEDHKIELYSYEDFHYSESGALIKTEGKFTDEGELCDHSKELLYNSNGDLEQLLIRKTFKSGVLKGKHVSEYNLVYNQDHFLKNLTIIFNHEQRSTTHQVYQFNYPE